MPRGDVPPGLARPGPAPACDASAHAGSAARSRRSSSGSPPPAAPLPLSSVPAASAAAALAHQVTQDPGLAFRGRRLSRRRGRRGSVAAARAGAVDARRRASRVLVGPRVSTMLAMPEPRAVWACRETPIRDGKAGANLLHVVLRQQLTDDWYRSGPLRHHLPVRGSSVGVTMGLIASLLSTPGVGVSVVGQLGTLT